MLIAFVSQACSAGQIEAANLLLLHGADTTATSPVKGGSNPLEEAMKHGHDDVAELLRSWMHKFALSTADGQLGQAAEDVDGQERSMMEDLVDALQHATGVAYDENVDVDAQAAKQQCEDQEEADKSRYTDVFFFVVLWPHETCLVLPVLIFGVCVCVCPTNFRTPLLVAIEG